MQNLRITFYHLVARHICSHIQISVLFDQVRLSYLLFYFRCNNLFLFFFRAAFIPAFFFVSLFNRHPKSWSRIAHTFFSHRGQSPRGHQNPQNNEKTTKKKSGISAENLG
jgi:hypothetical protein